MLIGTQRHELVSSNEEALREGGLSGKCVTLGNWWREKEAGTRHYGGGDSVGLGCAPMVEHGEQLRGLGRRNGDGVGGEADAANIVRGG